MRMAAVSTPTQCVQEPLPNQPRLLHIACPQVHYQSGYAPSRRMEMPGKPLFPSTKRIGVFVFDKFEPLDVFGFVEAFAIARFLDTYYSSPPPYPFEIFLIASKIAPVKSANGPSVAPDWDFQQ